MLRNHESGTRKQAVYSGNARPGGGSRAGCSCSRPRSHHLMRSHLLYAGLGLLGLALAAPAAAPPSGTGDRGDDVAALARKIDQYIEAGLKAKNAVAAPLAGDHE